MVPTEETDLMNEYRAPKTINKLVMAFNRIGVGRSVTLTTTGHISGEPRSVPVTPINVEGTEYIVAPYGAVAWVRNVRASPEVSLRSGGSFRTCRLVEVTSGAAPIVMAYWERETYPRRYMDLPPDPTLADFEAMRGSFPVFRVEDV